MLAQGKTVPAVAVGEQLKQQRPEVYERTDAAGNKIRETDQRITDKSFERVIETDTETKQIGTSQKTIDSDSTETIGGNKTVHVLGNIEEATASNKTSGVGGELSEKINGLAKRVSNKKNKFVAPLSYMGSEGQNIFRLLEETIQLLGEVANAVATHTHKGPKPDQSAIFSGQGNKAMKIKGRLTPIIE